MLILVSTTTKKTTSFSEIHTATARSTQTRSGGDGGTSPFLAAKISLNLHKEV